MDAPALQKHSRLPLVASLLALAFLSSCARDLIDDNDIAAPPVDLNQKVEQLPEEQLAKIIEKKQSDEKKQHERKAKKKKSAKKAPKKEAKKEEADLSSESPYAWTPKRWPFGVGEKISYRMRWGVIEGGRVSIEVKEPKVLDGEPVLHYHADVRSSRVLDLIYKIEDTMDTWVGADDHLPRRQEIRQNESGKWGRRVVLFDQKDKVSRYYSHTTRKDGKVKEVRRDAPLENFPQDIFGALYFYRFAEKMNDLNFPVHDRWKHWNNELILVKKEKLTVPGGTFNTIRFDMKPRVEGQLEPRGDVTAWFTDDEAKLMVKFAAKIRIGSVTGELMEYIKGRPMNLPLPVMKTPRRIHLERK